MRVLLVTRNYPPHGDGAEKQARILATGLARHSARVTVLTARRPNDAPTDTNEDVVIRRLGGPRDLVRRNGGARTLSLCALVLAFVSIHRGEFDVLHSNIGDQFGATAVASARLAGLPAVQRMATGGEWNDFKDLRSWRKRSLGWAFAPLLKLANRFVVLTPESVPALSREVQIERIRCIPNAVEVPVDAWLTSNVAEHRRRLGVESERPIIFGAGRLVPSKGFDVLIEAVSLIGDARLVVAGAGPEEGRFRALARQMGVDLHLLGKVPSHEVGQWMRAASVVAAPSYVEGISNTVLEALALGCPVVATNISGNRAVIDSGETGLLVEPGQANALASALKSFLSDSQTAGRYGMAARLDVQARFGVEALVARYEALYREISATSRGSSD